MTDETMNRVSAESDTGETAGSVAMPELLTVCPSPHIKHKDTTATIMRDVLIALTPALLWGTYVFGSRALTLVLFCVACSVGFEALTQKLLHRPITVGDLSAAVTGLLLGLNLPATAPYWMAMIGCAFAIVLVKQLFGGIGKNFMNPALAARVFLFAWPTQMTSFPAPFDRLPFWSFRAAADAVASATPLKSLRAGELGDVSLLDLFLGRCGGCIGEISALLLALGGIYLICRKVITWHIPVAFLGTVALLSLVSAPADMNAFTYMAASLFSGGLFLGAIFMATDYVTSPVTARGRLIFGVGCGLITVFIRRFGGYAEGVSFSILIMNSLVWYIDKFTRPRVFGGGAKRG